VIDPFLNGAADFVLHAYFAVDLTAKRTCMKIYMQQECQKQQQESGV
jgi:hypothetical protein